jgi:cell division protein FtsA
MAGTDLTHATIAVNGEHLSVLTGQARISVKTGTVREEDVALVTQQAAEVRLPSDREVVQVIRRGLAVDGFRGVVDPVGMVARELQAEVLVVTGATTVLRNLRRVVAMAGLTPVLWVAAPRASAEGVLADDEKQVGVVHLDVGGGTTGVTVYRGGHIQYLGVVPVGGEAVTSDLSLGLGVVTTQAERLKLEYAQVGSARDGTVEVRAVSGQSVKLIPVRELQEIVDARVDEWASLVEGQLQRVSWPKGPSAGVVLTGGGALLKGLHGFLEQRWSWPVRMGTPHSLGGLSDLSKSPGYAVVVGAARAQLEQGARWVGDPWWQRARQWWANLWR